MHKIYLSVSPLCDGAIRQMVHWLSLSGSALDKNIQQVLKGASSRSCHLRLLIQGREITLPSFLSWKMERLWFLRISSFEKFSTIWEPFLVLLRFDWRRLSNTIPWLPPSAFSTVFYVCCLRYTCSLIHFLWLSCCCGHRLRFCTYHHH